VLSLVAEEESGVTIEDAVLLTSWFMAVGQTTGGTDAHPLALKLQAATSVDPEFLKWAFNQATIYLGPKPQPRHVQVSTNTPAPASRGAEEMFQSMTTVLQNIAGGQNRALIESAKKAEESKPYDEFDMAALMGYCGVTQPDHVPGLWPQLKQAKKWRIRELLF
jgi:hypothetical protein